MKSTKKQEQFPRQQQQQRQRGRIPRLKPSKVVSQEERLQQETYYLQNDIEKLRRENQGLVGQMEAVQRDKDNYEHIILRVEDYIISRKLQGLMKKESNLVIGMKTQLQALRRRIKEHEDTLEALKRTPSVQLSLEKEIEYEVMLEHQEKLQAQAEGYYRFEGGTQLEDSREKRGEAVEAQMQQALDMMTRIARLDRQNQEMQMHNQTQGEEVAQQKDLLEGLHRQSQGQTLLYGRLQVEQQEKQEQKKQMEKVLRANKEKQPESVYNLEVLRSTLVQQEDVISAQQRQLAELMRKMESFKKNEVARTEALKGVLAEDKQLAAIMTKEIEDCLTDAVKRGINVAGFVNTSQKERLAALGAEVLPLLDQEQMRPEGNTLHLNGHGVGPSRTKLFKRVAKVQIHEVEKARREINLRLKEKRLDMESIHSMVREALQGKESVSVCELAHFLLQEPFLLSDVSLAEKLARYLVEDNYEDHLPLNYSRRLDLGIFRSVLNKLLGAQKVQEREVEQRVEQEVHAIISKYRLGLEQSYKQTRSESKKETFTQEQVLLAFNYFTIEFTPAQVNLMLQRLFAHSNDIDALDFSLLFRMYGGESLQDLRGEQKVQFRSEGYRLRPYCFKEDQIRQRIKEEDRVLYKQYESEQEGKEGT